MPMMKVTLAVMMIAIQLLKTMTQSEINGMDIPIFGTPADGQVVPSDVAPAASPGSQTLPGPSPIASAEKHLRLGLS